MGTSNRSEIIKWIVVIVVTIALGAFILTSVLVPEEYRLWLGILDYAIFTYANFKIIRISKENRAKKAPDTENRASRRQAERLKK